MREGYSFGAIQEEIEKKKKAKVMTKPLTREEHEDAEQQPMALKDHWLSLRHSIQEKLAVEKPTAEEQEKTKLLSELITPELMSEYQQILKEFNARAKKSEKHPQREFIDTNNEEFSEKIEKWTENLINEIKSKKEIGFDEDDIAELRAQCLLLFDSVGNVMNTRSLEQDIADFFKEKTIDEADAKALKKQKAELAKELQSRYPFDAAEIEILIDCITGEEEKYSAKILVETIARLWKEYHLDEKKGTVAKISLGYLMSKGIESFTPSLFQNIITGNNFNIAVFLEFFGLNKISECIDAKTEIELAKVMNKINYQINERIANSLFFQEFEFIHEKSLGEIYATLERGKNATERLLQDVISKFAPTLAGVAMSLLFLTKINPILGGISAAGYPIMWQIAKKQNKKICRCTKKKNGKEKR